MLELFGYVAFFHASDLGEHIVGIDRAAESAGLKLVQSTGGPQPQRRYSRGDLEPLSVSLAPGKRWSWASLDAVDRRVFSSYGPECIEVLLSRLNAHIEPMVGRSFSGSGFGTLEEYEGDGPIDFLDWYQYLGPDHVSTWGLEYLLRGPFSKVHPDDRGGCALMLGVSPFEGRLERRRAADYLGIKLRPIFARNSKGEPVQLEWE